MYERQRKTRQIYFIRYTYELNNQTCKTGLITYYSEMIICLGNFINCLRFFFAVGLYRCNE